MTQRPPAPSREAGPIHVATGPRMGTSWSALTFTLLVAVAVLWAAVTMPRWSARWIAPPQRVVAATAAPASPTPIPTFPTAASLSSAWTGQSPYPAILVGGTARVTMTFRNTGTATWRRGTPSEVRLGIIGTFDPSMSVAWPYPERPAVQSETTVLPGQIATFEFQVRGTHPGTFRFRVRPVVDSVTWLNDEGVYVDVEVR